MKMLKIFWKITHLCQEQEIHVTNNPLNKYWTNVQLGKENHVSACSSRKKIQTVANYRKKK